MLLKVIIRAPGRPLGEVEVELGDIDAMDVGFEAQLTQALDELTREELEDLDDDDLIVDGDEIRVIRPIGLAMAGPPGCLDDEDETLGGEWAAQAYVAMVDAALEALEDLASEDLDPATAGIFDLDD